MQQFGPQFINEHLMPLLEEMLTDTVQRKKDYLDQLFISGTLQDYERTNLMDYYFAESRKNNGVPFVDPEEKKDREDLLRYFIEHIRSRGSNPEERIRAFLPVLNQKSEGAVKQVIWPAEVKRNLFLMSYDIAEKFEKAKIDECLSIEEKAKRAEEAGEIQRDRKLFEKGLLILVKNPATGQFDKYVRATEVKPGDAFIQFIPAPTAKIVDSMRPGFALPTQMNLQSFSNGATSPLTVSAPSVYGNSPANDVKDVVSPYDEIVKSFHQKRGKSIKDQLQKQGFTVIGDVSFDANEQATVKVKSGNDTLLVAVDTKVPLAKDALTPQDLKFRFTFQDGTGRTFAVDESKLGDAFSKPDGTKRTATEYYNDAALRSRIEKGDAVPGQAPSSFGVLPPRAMAPGVAPIPGGAPIMPGGALRPIPREGAQALIPEEARFVLPKDLKAPGPLVVSAPGEKHEETLGESGEAAKKRTRGIPTGGAKKAEFFMPRKKVKKEEEEAGQVLVSVPPLADGRFRQAEEPAPEPKNNAVKIALAANLGSAGVFGGFGLWAGSSSSNSQTAMHVIQTVMVAVTKFFPHLFG